MKKWWILIVGFASFNLCAQSYNGFDEKPVRFVMSSGVGTSRISGYSALLEMGVVTKSNHFFVRSNYNSEIGKVDPDLAWLEVVRDRYNDHFFDASLMYGRWFGKNRFAVRSSVGISYGVYTDKWLEYSGPDTTVGLIDHVDEYHVRKFSERGIGVVVQGDAHYFISRRLGLGLIVYGNLNQFYSNFGACISLHAVLNRD